jgi:uncharacterized protein (DUF58 family)
VIRPVERQRWLPSLQALWNRGLPPAVRITHKVIWPLFLLPVALLNQFFAPHPVWIVLSVTLIGIYALGYYWVRSQASMVTLKRKRLGTILVAGDPLREEFELGNASHLPVLWAEFTDHANLPGYNAGRVVGCGANTFYRWNTNLQCRQRGVYQLGPYELALGDPLGLFALEIYFDHRDIVVIYPRVAHLPLLALPHGNASGTARRRRFLWGALPSASVREYQFTDSLRYIHWPLTAHRGELMVKELEIEPSGAVWVVLDLNAAAHTGEEERSTLEFGVILAASLTAALLNDSDRRAVGLLTVSGSQQRPDDASLTRSLAPTVDDVPSIQSTIDNRQSTITVAPQTGPAQLWRVLAALAPVQASNVTLAELLRSNRIVLGRRSTVMIITPQTSTQPGNQDWTAELLQLQNQGLVSSLLLITQPDEEGRVGQLRNLLAPYDISVQALAIGTRLPSALTFRRTRTVVRNTPTGGAVSYEVEEDVG